MNISLTKELAEFVYVQMYYIQHVSPDEEKKKKAKEVCERIVKGNRSEIKKVSRDRIRREMKADGFKKREIEETLVELNLKEPPKKKSRKGGKRK